MSDRRKITRRADLVNPDHYQGDYVMRVIEDFGLDFLSGTIVKYILRDGNKPGDSILQDLKKARWYLDRKIAGLSKSSAGTESGPQPKGKQ